MKYTQIHPVYQPIHRSLVLTKSLHKNPQTKNMSLLQELAQSREPIVAQEDRQKQSKLVEELVDVKETNKSLQEKEVFIAE